MVGVSSGLAATLGVLAPSQESFVQMATCMGAGMYCKKSSVQNCDTVSVIVEVPTVKLIKTAIKLQSRYIANLLP